MDFKNLDLGFLKKLADPKSSGDLNAFLEKLPKNAGQTVLIAAGIAWATAAALGLFTTIKSQELTQYRMELQELESLKPNVPRIAEKPADSGMVKRFADNLQEIYKGLDVKASGSKILITSKNTARFTEFREAIAHVQNGGETWKVGLEKLCLGRECKPHQLAVSLTINEVSVDSL